MENYVETFHNIEAALRAHGVTTAQLEALCKSDPALQIVAARIAQLVPPNGAMSYALLYPGFDHEMPLKLRNALSHEGITNVGSLQIYTAEEIRDIRRLGPQALRTIQSYLRQHGLRLREESQSRHDRLRDVYPNAKLIPVLFLPVDADELHFHGIHTYGDLQICKRSELINLKSSYEGNRPLCFTAEDVNKIEAEITLFELSFTPESG